MGHMLIKARLATELGMPNATGYRLCGVNPDGETEIEEGSYPTAKAAYTDAKSLWPANSTWQGQRVSGGYRITVSSAALLGRKGGAVGSAAQKAAARENGKKGGRPRKA